MATVFLLKLVAAMATATDVTMVASFSTQGQSNRRVPFGCSGCTINSQNRMEGTANTQPSSRNIMFGPAKWRMTQRHATTSSTAEAAVEKSVGLYRPFADYAWNTLLENTDWFVEDSSVPDQLALNTAPAKGFPEGSIVRMTTKALQPTKPSLVRYARYALLETLVPSSDDSSSPYNSTAGIQVLNLVIFPSASTNLPVLGADFVALPGNRHLLLLDAQPMDAEKSHQAAWKEWHQRHVIGSSSSSENGEAASSFAWGGDMPEEVACYVSEYALWTRLVDTSSSEANKSSSSKSQFNPIPKIQTDLWDAYKDHLDVYLQLLSDYDGKESSNEQEPYIHYRLNNDPAKPMLKSLYGEEFTDRVLHEVLFPNIRKSD